MRCCFSSYWGRGETTHYKCFFAFCLLRYFEFCGKLATLISIQTSHFSSFSNELTAPLKGLATLLIGEEKGKEKKPEQHVFMPQNNVVTHLEEMIVENGPQSWGCTVIKRVFQKGSESRDYTSFEKNVETCFTADLGHYFSR